MKSIDSLLDELTIDSAEKFDHALRALVRKADENQVDILGGKRINTDADRLDYGIEIYHVTRTGE